MEREKDLIPWDDDIDIQLRLEDYPAFKKAMEENLLQIWKGKIKVLPSGLASGDAAVLGASALGLKAKNEN